MELTIGRPERRERVRRDKQENILKPCRVCDCQEKREGLSRYCSLHADRAGRYGSPTLKPIDQRSGIAALAKELARDIKDQKLPELERRLLATMSRSLPKGQAYVYRNREIETGITTAEKARVILATAAHKAGADLVLAYAILWAIAQEVDRPIHSNDQEMREFFRAHLGNDLATLADIGRQWRETKRTYRADSWHQAGQAPALRLVSEEPVTIKKKQSIRGAVKRKAGRLLLDLLFQQLGPTRNWIEDTWATPYTQTLRDRLNAPMKEREYVN